MAKYYVSPDGNNSWTGLTDSDPFRTLEHAHSRVNVTEVSVREDFVQVGFSPQKAGTLENPILFTSYGLGVFKPTITGRKLLTGWTSIGNGLYKVNDAGFMDRVKFLLFNGVQSTVATYPRNRVYNQITGGSGNATGTIQDTVNLSGKNFTGGEVVTKKLSWCVDTMQITNHTGSTLTFTGGSSTYDVTVGWGYFVQNHRDCCTQLGDWCQEGDEIVMYFGSEDPSGYTIYAPYLQRVYFNNHGNNQFHGFRFEMFNGGSTLLSDSPCILTSISQNLKFYDCDFEFMGNTVFYHLANDNNGFGVYGGSVRNCLNLFYWNRHGTFSPSFDIENVTFENVGNIKGAGGNGSIGYTCIMASKSANGINIKRNKFFNIGYNAVNFDGSEFLVEENYAYNACFVKDDGAAFYHFGKVDGTAPVQDRNKRVVRRNIAVNCLGSNDGKSNWFSGTETHGEVMGFYLDDDSYEIRLEENTAINCALGSRVNNARDLDIYGNLFALCKRTQIIIASGPTGSYRNTNVNFSGNILYAEEGGVILELQTNYSEGSNPTDIALIGPLNNNYYIRPGTEGGAIKLVKTGTNANTWLYSVEGWKSSVYGQDSNSKSSPTTSSIYEIALNDSDSTIEHVLTRKRLDVDGNLIDSNFNLLPYSAKLLLDDLGPIVSTFDLTVRENPIGWGTAIDLTNQSPYEAGTLVNLQAVANPDTVFARWSRDGVTLSTNTNFLYTARAQDDLILGEFTPKKYMLTLQTDGAGTVFPAPAEYFQGQPIELTATADEGWQFTNWTKNGVPISTSAIFTYTKLAEDEVLVANFTQSANRTLTVQVNPVGSGTTNISSQQHAPGQVINLVAMPNTGYSFTIWTKNGVAISSEPSFAYTTSDQNETLVANFLADTVYYTLTVNSNPTAGGTTNVTSVQHEEYEIVPLLATPNAGYIFVNWAKNGVSISTNPELNYTAGPLNETITANFARLEYTVTINGAAGGTAEVVTLPPYYEGDTVQVKATPDAGFYFVEWIMFIPPSTGTVGAGQPTFTFTMPQGNVEFTPVFEEVPPEAYTLVVVASPEEGGIASGGGSYTAGSVANLQADAFDGWEFRRWVRGTTTLSTSPEFAYSTRAQNDTISAVFEEIPPVTYIVEAIAGFGGTTTGGGEYEEGSEASLAATASPGLQFIGWYQDGIKITEQNPYIFSVWEDTSVTAMFAPLYTLVVNSNTGGTATGGGVFVEFDQVSVFATPAMGYRFAGWFENGSKVSEDRLYTFPITRDRVLLAQFAPLDSFTVTPSAGEGGTVSGGGVYFDGDTATVTAAPDEGTSFIRWEKDGLAVSGEAVYSFTVTEDVNLVAIFGPKVKYRCDFRNHFNDLCRVDITFEGYSGETILLRSSESNGCTIEREVSEDPYDPIVVTKARTTLIQEEHNPIDVRELQEAEDREFVLSFYIEGELNFTGFVVPDGIQQIFQSPPYDVTISATDGLRLLSGIPYRHNNLPGGRNPMNYFRQILFANLGLPLPIKWVNTITNDNWPDEDVFTGSVRWAPRGEGFTDYSGTVKDGLYILENMLRSMQCRIFQDKGHWVIWRINDVVSGQFTYKGIAATLGQWEITESQVDINRTVGGIRDGYDYSFIEEDAYVTSKKALKTVQVVYEHEQRDNILPNGSMDLVNSIFNAPLYWGITNGTTATVSSVPSLSADRGFAVEVNNDWFQTQPCIFSLVPNKLPIDSDVLYGNFNFSFTFAILSGVYLDPDGFIVWENTPFPLRITYNAGNKTYYLNEFGYWTEQNGWIQLQVESLKVGDVASIDFRAKQPNIILPLPSQSPIGRTDTPYLTIELGIPDHRRIIFDDITFSVDNANDIYEAVSSLAGNSASESYALKISSSHNGFHLSNYMTNFDRTGEEKFFSDSKLTAATLTEMTAHAIVRNRYKPSILFEASLYSRKYSYGELYNVMLLDGKKLLPLKSSWNTETNTVKLTATEVRDDGTGIYVRHYASNDNTKQSYGQQ